ncbi:Dethiobiotin synthetase [Sphaerospermopsis aphanizomenoides BCCUSP55]|uniref:Dethiobiotin synthetase n=1 Tax=Sphaerospermopsis aphanizomenoides TaxID=459663 RepID=UPI000A9E08E0|nr:Dethiobiotin synthetase [Sphaerospermopsis aphanizomenoides]MBK1990359.1 Dethiobiotin synthetase [Sphaerospermopsis aphanizomenoides BCCUSP55]
MNYEIARKLLIDQTTNDDNSDALLNRLKQGKPPVPGQITSVLLALKVVFEALKDATSLDKELAFALYKLGIRALQFFATGRKAGIDWPPLLQEDLQRISLATESIFCGKWQTLQLRGKLKDEV